MLEKKQTEFQGEIRILTQSYTVKRSQKTVTEDISLCLAYRKFPEVQLESQGWGQIILGGELSECCLRAGHWCSRFYQGEW